jgi:large subunit ribosomal protein L17
MRHGKKFNHLGRTSSHRRALLSNLASSLILNKRISTTLAKAKELRKYVEPLLTKSKDDSTHSRRIIFSYLQNKDSVNILFTEVSEKIANRPGGYTRIIKTGNRLGDNSDMCIIELVDYNEMYGKEVAKGASKSKVRRSRRGSGSSVSKSAASDATIIEELSPESKPSKNQTATSDDEAKES